MKVYKFILAGVAVLGLGMTACNNDDVEGVSKFSPSFFMPKAPTFTSWGFVIT